MVTGKPARSSGMRGEPVRRRVLDAAERLLRDGRADFSMRDLASEAGVSFATPFNHFGGKTALMHALAERRIDAMIQRFEDAEKPTDTFERAMMAADIAVSVILSEPAINRAVMGSIGTAGPEIGTALAHARTLWTLALGEDVGLSPLPVANALRGLPDMLAVGFRGILSFWTAGEMQDAALLPTARRLVECLFFGVRDEPSAND